MKALDDSREVVCDRVETEIVDSPLGDDHDVYGALEELGLGPECFPDPPLDAVSLDGVSDLL